MDFIIKIINKILYNLFYYFIFFYQKVISPITPARCRYYPTCSNYGKQALAWHGVWAGSWLLLKRIGRCQPWGGHGIDFVPLPLASYTYTYTYTYLHITSPCSHMNISTATTPRHDFVYRDDSSYGARLNYLMR
jgi:hypothetical protein